MGLSVEMQRELKRTQNRINGNTEQGYKFKRKKRSNPKLDWNRKHAHKLAHDQREAKNKHELMFRQLLIDYEIPHIWQKPFYCVKRFVCVDFYFNKLNLVVEIDGFYHHGKRNIKKDNQRTKYLKQAHKVIDVLRVNVWELENDIDLIKDLLIDKLY